MSLPDKAMKQGLSVSILQPIWVFGPGLFLFFLFFSIPQLTSTPTYPFKPDKLPFKPDELRVVYALANKQLFKPDQLRVVYAFFKLFLLNVYAL